MKIITAPTPSWFYSSQSFINKRLPDYSNYPNIVLPNGFLCSTMLRTTDEVNQISNGVHPQGRVGYNIFYTNHGGLTTYPDSKLAIISDVGYNPSNPTDENQWFANLRPEKIVWYNGENIYGYDGDAIMQNPSKKAKLASILQQCKGSNPNGLFSTYSWDSITGGVRPRWYGASNYLDAFYLGNLYTNPANIKTAQIEAGFNSAMQQVYSINDDYYDTLALTIMQIQLFKIKHGNQYPIVPLLWGLTEPVDSYPFPHSTQRVNQLGVYCGIKGYKENAPAEYMYSMALICLLLTKNLIGWNGRNREIVTEDINQEHIGDDVFNSSDPLVTMGTDTQQWIQTNVRSWQSVELYNILAMYQVSLQKTILEDTTYDWESPDFIVNGTLRNGLLKTVPFNKYYKEPTVVLKYNTGKTKCLILAINCWASNTDINQITVIEPNTGKEIPVLLNGKKAEFISVEL